MYLIREVGSKAIFQDAAETVEISIDRHQCLGLISILEPPAILWPEGFNRAFDEPIGTSRLHILAQGARRVVIIVSDSTRGVPTAKVVPILLSELSLANVPRAAVTVVVATGVHRPATRGEIEEIVGVENLKDLKVVNHDPYNKEQLVTVGKTSFRTLVEVNRAVHEADLRIAVGKVEPHEFAGFSGGRKSVLPGIAGEKAIMFNHRPEMLISPAARPGQLEGNPIHLDMVEAAEMLKIHFMVNLVVNQAGETIGIFTGDPSASHLSAVEFLRSFCQVIIDRNPDIVVTTPGKPLNINFYQSVKPLIALASVMERGSVLVLYSSCREGMGTEDMLIPFEGAKNIETVISRLKADYRIQMDHALLLGKIMQKGINIVVACQSVDAATLKKIFMTPALNPQDALEKALKMVKKPSPMVLFFPQAQRALPVLNKAPKPV